MSAIKNVINYKDTKFNSSQFLTFPFSTSCYKKGGDNYGFDIDRDFLIYALDTSVFDL